MNVIHKSNIPNIIFVHVVLRIQISNVLQEKLKLTELVYSALAIRTLKKGNYKDYYKLSFPVYNYLFKKRILQACINLDDDNGRIISVDIMINY